MRNSHCLTGDFGEYHDDVAQAVAFIRSRGMYDQLLGYAHSTGAPVLLDYLMAHGDSDFSGFIFNSPFLDWGWVGGWLNKKILVHLPAWSTALRAFTDDSEILSGGGASAWALQAPLARVALHALARTSRPDAAHSQMWSQYGFDPACRPVYRVPLTIGYCRAINKVHAKLRRRSAAGVPTTLKPFVVLTSKGDDVLNGDETMVHAHSIGPSRTLIELTYARHDVFCSDEADVVDSALRHLHSWLSSQGFAQ